MNPQIPTLSQIPGLLLVLGTRLSSTTLSRQDGYRHSLAGTLMAGFALASHEVSCGTFLAAFLAGRGVEDHASLDLQGDDGGVVVAPGRLSAPVSYPLLPSSRESPRFGPVVL
jgi:hypothetical protein